ncbi:MAG: hypothetical protein WA957_03830 [Alteraurantiacibacter sp.]
MAMMPVSGSLDEFREIVADLEDLEGSLNKRFNRQLFRRVRRMTGSQSEWGLLAGVSQVTIGNWERGYTVPSRSYRRGLISACRAMKDKISKAFSNQQSSLRINPLHANRELNRSILTAALTDFDFDQVRRQVIPVPFDGDFDDELAAEIAEDRANLLNSLAAQADLLVASINDGSNLQEQKIVRIVTRYAEETRSTSPNPRLLNRLGTTISRTGNSDDFRGAMNDIDAETLDGFGRDHIELMRLYFKEALAQAQELDGAGTIDEPGDITGEEFLQVASMMEDAVTTDGEPFVEASIPLLLRDIAREVQDMNENILLTSDDRRIEIFNRRKSEAFKNGGVYVGRFVFFAALLGSVAVPGVPAIMTALSLMVGLTEGFAPGTIRARYERLREKFRALPALPINERDDGEL